MKFSLIAKIHFFRKQGRIFIFYNGLKEQLIKADLIVFYKKRLLLRLYFEKAWSLFVLFC